MPTLCPFPNITESWEQEGQILSLCSVFGSFWRSKGLTMPHGAQRPLWACSGHRHPLTSWCYSNTPSCYLPALNTGMLSRSNRFPVAPPLFSMTPSSVTLLEITLPWAHPFPAPALFPSGHLFVQIFLELKAMGSWGTSADTMPTPTPMARPELRKRQDWRLFRGRMYRVWWQCEGRTWGLVTWAKLDNLHGYGQSQGDEGWGGHSSSISEHVK